MIPGIFMLLTTIASLFVVLFKGCLPKQYYILAAGDIVLRAPAGGVVVLAVKKFSRPQPVADF